MNQQAYKMKDKISVCIHLHNLPNVSDLNFTIKIFRLAKWVKKKV